MKIRCGPPALGLLVALAVGCDDDGAGPAAPGSTDEPADEDDDGDGGSTGAAAPGTDDPEPEPTSTSEGGDDSAGPDDTSGDSGGASQPPVLPTWVLRDAGGEPVPALVTPTCGDPGSLEGHCPVQEIGRELEHNCVIIHIMNDVAWNIPFRLSDGSATACSKHFDDWTDTASDGTSAGTYFNDTCQGQPYKRNAGPSGALELGDELYYGFGEPATHPACPDGNAIFSAFDNGSCESFTFSETCNPYVPIIPVTSEIYDLLPNPPYTVRLEH